MKLIFALTAGRTGSAYLAELLRQNVSDAETHHEILSYVSFGTDTPDISHLHAFNNVGNTPKIQQFWQRKFQKVLACGKSCYAETSHLLMKAGLVENAAAMLAGHEVHFVILQRDIFQTIASYHQRGDFLNYGNIWMWYLDPSYARNIVGAKPFAPFGVHGIRLWYLAEMNARFAFYRCRYGHWRKWHFHLVNIEALNDMEGVRQLFRAMGLPAKHIRIPPKQNMNVGSVVMDDQERELLRQLISRLNLSESGAVAASEKQPDQDTQDVGIGRSPNVWPAFVGNGELAPHAGGYVTF
jgi:hypothetical protein